MLLPKKHDKRHKPDDASLSKLLMRACEMHSNTSSGVILGRHKVSHMPREKLNINIFQKFLSSLLVHRGLVISTTYNEYTQYKYSR